MSAHKKGFALPLIIGLVVVIIIGTVAYLQFKPKPSAQTNNQNIETSYASQEECEAKTGKPCGFVMCDVVPEGKTFEETCGKGFKTGWKPKTQSTTPSPVSKYFKSNEECQTSTGKSCDCMLTKPDTAESNPTCIGWEPIHSSANWKTYTATNYSFGYPPNLKINPNNSAELLDENRKLFLSIYSFDPAVVGISYCEAYSNDRPRCEQLKVGDKIATIDWNVNDKAYAMLGNLSVTLSVTDNQAKKLFIQILSTFKFLN